VKSENALSDGTEKKNVKSDEPINKTDWKYRNLKRKSPIWDII